jgi:hypothetical protein
MQPTKFTVVETVAICENFQKDVLLSCPSKPGKRYGFSQFLKAIAIISFFNALQ